MKKSTKKSKQHKQLDASIALEKAASALRVARAFKVRGIMI